MRSKSLKKVVVLLACAVFSLTTLTSTSFAQELSTESKSKNCSDIVYSGRDIEYDLMFDDIIVKLKEYKEKHPEASDSEMNTYTDKLMKKAVKKSEKKSEINVEDQVSTQVYTDMDGYVSGYLNKLELALYNSNKAKGLLCMANGKLALGYAEDNYISSVLHNGNGDAFRHCLWNYGMVIDVGYSFAKQWSDAHENGATNSPQIEKTMDLYNILLDSS